jgi:hypothetical protein
LCPVYFRIFNKWHDSCQRLQQKEHIDGVITELNRKLDYG